ncbi:C4-dicarboxylate transporter/malic acid transporter [Stagonosporopsis vannaccii]|nr:C4-dicarboxylate transporter/malic acid transporter [Stagonosporopsis vannaccii]
MDSRFQPEGLTFDNKDNNNFSPNFDNTGPSYSRPQSDPRPALYPAPIGLPSSVRPVSPPRQAQYAPQAYQPENRYPNQSPQHDNRTLPMNVPQPTNVQQDSQYPLQSQQTTRTNTWVQTPAGPYPTGDAYYTGPVDVNGYPIDSKGKAVENPFNDPPPPPPAMPTPPASIDLEKQKHDDHGHGSGWDHTSKLPHRKDPNQPYMSFGERLRHFTWAWYTLTMATGGIATLISVQPHAFPGLITIGAVFFIINLIFFVGITGTMILRFTKFPGAFKGSITHEREALFLGPFFLSVATIITGTQKYIIQAYEIDHPNRAWAITSMSVAFWLYTFFAFCLASFQYSFLFSAHTYKVTSFMPSWLLPIFPIMLSGTIASVIAADQPLGSRYPIIVAGLGCQGLGFTVAILMYAHYIGRLMQVGYPDREHRGAMFIGVGPPSFTCLAFIGMANALPEDFDIQGDGLLDGKLIRTLAIVAALFLWVLAMWFFMIALIAVINSWAVYFHLGWWAMVFPNTGFAIATISIGNALKDETILFVGNGLSIAIIAMWFYVLFNHVQSVIVGDILYPMRDEDVADH